MENSVVAWFKNWRRSFLLILLRKLFFQILEEYNVDHNVMNLVLFDDALEHLTRIHRVIRMDQVGFSFILYKISKICITAYRVGFFKK